MTAPENSLADAQREENLSSQSPHTTHLHDDLSLQALDNLPARGKRKELVVETLSTISLELVERVAKRQLLVTRSSLASVNVVNGVMVQGLVEESKDAAASEVSGLSGTKLSKRLEAYELDYEPSGEWTEGKYEEKNTIEPREKTESAGSEIKPINPYADTGEHDKNNESRSKGDFNKAKNEISEQAQEDPTAEERAKAEEGVEFCGINVGDALSGSHKSEEEAIEHIDKEEQLMCSEIDKNPTVVNCDNENLSHKVMEEVKGQDKLEGDVFPELQQEQLLQIKKAEAVRNSLHYRLLRKQKTTLCSARKELRPHRLPKFLKKSGLLNCINSAYVLPLLEYACAEVRKHAKKASLRPVKTAQADDVTAEEKECSKISDGKAGEGGLEEEELKGLLSENLLSNTKEVTSNNNELGLKEESKVGTDEIRPHVKGDNINEHSSESKLAKEEDKDSILEKDNKKYASKLLKKVKKGKKSTINAERTLLCQIPNFIKQSHMSVKYVKFFIQFLHEELKASAMRFYSKRMLLRLLNSIAAKERSEQQKTEIKEIKNNEKLKRISIYFSAQEENEVPLFAEEEKLLIKEEAKPNRASAISGKRLFGDDSSHIEEDKVTMKEDEIIHNKKSFSKFNYFNDLEDGKNSPDAKEAALKFADKMYKAKYKRDEDLIYPYPNLNDSGEFEDYQKPESTAESPTKSIPLKNEEVILSNPYKKEKDTILQLHKSSEDPLAAPKQLEEEGAKDGEEVGGFLKEIEESARIKSKLFSFYEVDGVLVEDSKKNSEEKTASEAKPDNEVAFSDAVRKVRKEKEGQEVEGRSYSAPMKPAKDSVPPAGARGGGFPIDEMGEDDLVFPMKMGESDLQIPIISLDSEEPIIPSNLVKVKESIVNFNIVKPFRPFSGEQSELEIRISQEDQKEVKVLESDLHSIMEQNTKLASNSKNSPAAAQSPIQAKEPAAEDSYKEVNIDIDGSFSSDSEKADEEIQSFLSNPMHVLPLLTTMTIN